MSLRPWPLLLLAACGPDLPAGWEDAVPVDSLTQTECLGISPYEAHDERVEGDLGASPLEVDLAPDAVTVYRRWDNLNDPNDPVEIGALTRP